VAAPVGSGAEPFIDGQDIAEVVVTVLTRRPPNREVQLKRALDPPRGDR